MTSSKPAAPATRDWSETLFLPKTSFPMKAGLPDLEPRLLTRWAELGMYQRLRAAAKGRPRFILHDGPPYANGNIHIGTALNKILKDMVTRGQQMLGYDSNYVPGWDCHGLPIEWQIEQAYRAKGKRKEDVPVLELIDECRAFAQRWIDIQREEFKRLGVEGDWDHPYTTMAPAAEAQIARELMKFVATGQLYRGSKPVMWSVVEKTALAEAEIEYQEFTSDTVWVKFPVLSPKAAMLPEGTAVVIWTTTPWTLPGNRAISFNSKIAYGLFEVTRAPEGNWAKPGDKLILAQKLAEPVMKAAKVEAFDLKGIVRPDVLASIACAHPLSGIGGGYRFDVPSSTGTTSPTRTARGSSTRRPATAARTSRSGWGIPRRWWRGISTPPFRSPSMPTGASPGRRRASRASASSRRRATRATPTAPSSRRSWRRAP
jgi:isoleucyl-tRNA synthetase